MKKLLVLLALLTCFFISPIQAQVSYPDTKSEFGIGVEALSEVLLGIRLGQRWQDSALLADVGALPTEEGTLIFYRLSARRYKGIFYGFIGFAQWLRAVEGAFIDVGVGGELRLGGLGVSLEIGPAIPLTNIEDSENTQAFITSLSMMYWF